MVIGTGMIANAFFAYKENRDVVIFASGVSNSLLNEESVFCREKELLMQSIESNPDAAIVYFGTCSVNDPELFNAPYVVHKRAMEELIERSCKRYFIFRLSQVVGYGSSPTLINFIVDRLIKREHFSIWKNSKRNLIDIDDVFKIADYLIKNGIFMNEITNIATPLSLSIFNIVAIIEELLGQKGHYEVENRGGSYNINIDKISPYLKESGICFFDEYPKSIIEKYFFKK